MIIFYQISRETLQMKFDKQEWATRGNFASWSYEIQNHDRKAYSKASIPWEEKILWCNHNIIVTLGVTANLTNQSLYK